MYWIFKKKNSEYAFPVKTDLVWNLILGKIDLFFATVFI